MDVFTYIAEIGFIGRNYLSMSAVDKGGVVFHLFTMVCICHYVYRVLSPPYSKYAFIAIKHKIRS